MPSTGLSTQLQWYAKLLGDPHPQDLLVLTEEKTHKLGFHTARHIVTSLFSKLWQAADQERRVSITECVWKMKQASVPSELLVSTVLRTRCVLCPFVLFRAQRLLVALQQYPSREKRDKLF